jgi:hypothetical protein
MKQGQGNRNIALRRWRREHATLEAPVIPYQGVKEGLAHQGLEALFVARAWFKQAGSSRTLARIDAAISSARGAVRAAGYRDRRRRPGG